MKKYYLHNGSQQTGPFDIEELKLKNLNSETSIWFEGLEEWTTIGEVEELKEVFSSKPPPFPNKPSSQQPNHNKLSQTNVTENSSKQSSSIGRSFLRLGAIIVLGLIGYYIYNQLQHQQYQNERQEKVNIEEDAKAMFRNNITSYVTAERSEYQYSKLGGIYNLKISVTNGTDYLVDNVKVRVIYIKANGEVWSSRTIDFNLINPHSKNTIEVPDSERGTSVEYEIVNIKSTALGLN